MITSDHNEKLPSSSSSVSSTCSSSASSTGLSSISTVSYNQGTGSSLTTSSSSSPSSSNNNAPVVNSVPPTINSNINNKNASCFQNKQEQLAFDFQAIMNDLKNVCGTLGILARQIDQIVNKMDDKFSLIAENMNISSHLDESYQIKRTINKTAKLSDLIKCTNTKNNNTLNDSVYSNGKSHLPPASLFTLGQSKPKQQQIVNSLKPSFSNPNETLLANLINENYATILNTQTNKMTRTLSDRKPISLSSTAGDDLKKNFSLNFSTSTPNPITAPALDTHTFLVPGNSQTFNRSTNRPNNLAQESRINFNSNNNTNNSNQGSLGHNKPRCIRSKSQPAFVKSEGNDYHSFVLHNSTNSASTNGGSVNSNNMKIKVPVAKIFSEMQNDSDDNKSAQTNESSFYEDQLDNELEGFENSSKALLTNLGNSKFKKDDKPPIASKANTIISNSNSNNNNNNNNENILNNLNTNASNYCISFSENGSIINSSNNSNKSMTPNLKTPNGPRTRSSNSNHHVSFNINNAIYTSRQETPVPIPISILKQKANEQKPHAESKYSNLANGPLNLFSFPSMSTTNTSVNSSPLPTSSIKKPGFANPGTILISEQQQQNLQQIVSDKDNEQSKSGQSLRSLIANSSTSNISKSVRIDSKTTIL